MSRKDVLPSETHNYVLAVLAMISLLGDQAWAMERQ
jgi:hypothetical protein